MQTKPRAKRPTLKTTVEITWFTRWEYFLKFMQVKQALENMRSEKNINPDRCLEECITRLWDEFVSPIGLS